MPGSPAWPLDRACRAYSNVRATDGRTGKAINLLPMDGAWLVRMRWRWRGAWLWPTFAAVTIADGVIGNALPPAGETETVLAGVLAGLVLNGIAVLLFSRPLGAALRRVRRDLPIMVARNYGGTFAVALVSLGLLTAGLVHRPMVLEHQRALQDAIAR